MTDTGPTRSAAPSGRRTGRGGRSGRGRRLLNRKTGRGAEPRVEKVELAQRMRLKVVRARPWREEDVPAPPRSCSAPPACATSRSYNAVWWLRRTSNLGAKRTRVWCHLGIISRDVEEVGLRRVRHTAPHDSAQVENGGNIVHPIQAHWHWILRKGEVFAAVRPRVAASHAIGRRQIVHEQIRVARVPQRADMPFYSQNSSRQNNKFTAKDTAVGGRDEAVSSEQISPLESIPVLTSFVS